MEDRFGKIPTQGKELIRVVRLRRLAKTLGIEKIMFKNKQMALMLIQDEKSPYYTSSAFDKLLAYVQNHPSGCQLREVGKKRSVAIKNISNIETAVSVLEEMVQN